MSDQNKKTTVETTQIEDALKSHFPGTSAYRYNSASIRVRVVDERFAGKSMAEREDMLLPLVHQLPDDIQADITLLLLLTPDEAPDSLMNLEFLDPSPSML